MIVQPVSLRKCSHPTISHESYALTEGCCTSRRLPLDPKRELKLDGWEWDRSFGLWSSFAAGYSQFREAIQGSARPFVDHVAKWPEVSLEAASTVELRPYQQEAIAHWNGFKRHGLVVLPTGTGKTEIALEIMRRTTAPTLVVAPVKDLMHQWHRRIAPKTTKRRIAAM